MMPLRTEVPRRFASHLEASYLSRNAEHPPRYVNKWYKRCTAVKVRLDAAGLVTPSTFRMSTLAGTAKNLLLRLICQAVVVPMKGWFSERGGIDSFSFAAGDRRRLEVHRLHKMHNSRGTIIVASNLEDESYVTTGS